MIASRKPVWYLAGPMSGLPQFNFPAFLNVAEKLRLQHYTVISPAELDDDVDLANAMASIDGSPGKSGRSWGDFLARDVKVVADMCTGVILLPGWENSRGAKLESFVALLCGHEFAAWDADLNAAYAIAEEDVRAVAAS